jgi:hypothetical protein
MYEAEILPNFFQKEETLKRVNFTIGSYRMLYEQNSDPQWLKLLNDSLEELELLKDLPDDNKFMYSRLELLTKHKLLKP